MRLYSYPGNDLTRRFPPIIESIARSRSCIIDGEAAACDDNARSDVDRARRDHRRTYAPPEIACKLKKW
jgi:ATP-dependent DNA ligase